MRKCIHTDDPDYRCPWCHREETVTIPASAFRGEANIFPDGTGAMRLMLGNIDDNPALKELAGKKVRFIVFEE